MINFVNDAACTLSSPVCNQPPSLEVPCPIAFLAQIYDNMHWVSNKICKQMYENN